MTSSTCTIGQLHPDERQWIANNIKAFEAYYQSTSQGQTITDQQASDMLLVAGFQRVDSTAANSAPGNDIARQFLATAPSDLFYATPLERSNPSIGANANGSLTPEQLALQGVPANPALGVTITAALATSGLSLAPEALAALASACRANPVLCMNEVGIAAGEVAAGGAMPAGTGAAVVAGAVAGDAKTAAQEGAAAASVGGANSTAMGSASLGRTLGQYSAVAPGPLADNIAGTFAGGKYSVIVLQQDTTLYRAGTIDQPLGQYFSLEPPTSVLQTRVDKAVLPVWPGGGTSPLDTSLAVKIPTGTEVYVGEVGAQGGFYVGGTQQIVVVKPWTIPGVQVINVSPLK